MSAEAIAPIGQGSSTPSVATVGNGGGGGAGRGGGENGSGGPLVVVQQGRGSAPPRPAPRPAQGNTDNSLRNGYAALSHSVSGETAAIGLGFLVAGPVGAIVGGSALPVLVAASMWRARRREHDENTNRAANGTGDSSGSGRDRSGSGGGGRHRSPNSPGGSGGGRHKTPKSPGSGSGGGLGGSTRRKPKVKDPVADKLGKLGKGLADKLKPNKTDKAPKNGRHDRTGGKDGTSPKTASDKGAKSPKHDGAKGLKDGLRDGLKLKDRGKQPDSDRAWRGRGHKDKPAKPKKDGRHQGDDTTWTSARDGLDPKALPRGKDPVEERIELVRARREKAARRAATRVGKRAAADAARDGTAGDPRTVQLERIRSENQWIDLELHREAQLLALAAGTEQRRSTPVTYPVATTQPAGTRTAGVAVARQIDPRGSTAYQLLAAMAEQLAHGLHDDEDADMADHVIELFGIPIMCRNLGLAVVAAGAALSKTAPLHPSVVKHLNNAAVAAMTAQRMSETIIVVFVDAHREDMFRVLSPRIGEERWNLRNGPGTLDAAKMRAAIMSANTARAALPAGSGGASTGTGKLVPASHGSTKRLVTLMKGFERGHMVVCLSEIAGAASGVEVVADSITKLYRRMARSWPTEDVVDDTVRATASKVRTIAVELRKAIKAAQRAHQRELKLNAKPRKGARAEKAWDVTKNRRG